MKVTTVVVAHIKRTAHAVDLGAHVGADNVFIDPGGYGEWENHERAIKWALVHANSVGSSHILVVQDDALPIGLFRTAVAGLVTLRPDDMIGLYVGTHRPRRRAVAAAVKKADELDAMWLSHPDLLWGVATLIPVQYVPEMLEYAAASTRPYDLRLGRAWAAVRGEEKPVIYAWPSLVNHRDEPTVIAGRTPTQGRRVAHRVGTPTPLHPDLVVPIEDVPLPGRSRRPARKNLSSY